MRLALFFVPALLLGQSGPSNLAFENGTPGDPPPGWVVPQVLKALGYSAEIRREGCRSAGCAVLLSPDAPPPETFGNLTQSFDATPFRGQTVRLRASVKLGSARPADHAQMWLRVDLPNQQMGFFDNMADRPISSTEWKSYEIAGEVAASAQLISIGVMSYGTGQVWIDGVTLDVVPNATANPELIAARAAIRKLYSRIDFSYAQKDLDAVASLALPDAQILTGSTKIPISSALIEIMKEIEKGARYTSRSTVTDVRLSGEDAIVSVNNEATRKSSGGTQILASTSRDTWMKVGSEWRLKESALISTRSVIPPTDTQTTEAIVAELRRVFLPLVRAYAPEETAGMSVAPLEAFGKAVGAARIVALGEASHGTHEFFEIKHRLLRYLVEEKGFTVIAVEANWPEALAVDRYIKTGEGSARAALAGMYFWAWNTEEMIDLVEWMRSYNQAPGKHPILTFTSFDMQRANVAAQKALEFLGRYAPGDVEAAGETYTEVQMLETRRAQIYDDKAKAVADRAATVVKLFDSKRAALIAASSPEAWRDARQAANIVYQACTIRIPGNVPLYREESMARNVEWLIGQAHPHEKVVLWAHNAHVAFGASSRFSKSMGAWLRERLGKQMYVAGFAFRQGSLRAVGMDSGKFTALSIQEVPPSPAGSGDAVLSAAGMQAFFLDMASLPAGPLARWLAEPHLFHNVGTNWVIDNPDANLEPLALSKLYDGLIFVEESHAARAIER